jgi:hypothetical protein
MSEQIALQRAATTKMDELFDLYRDVYKISEMMIRDIRASGQDPIWIPIEFDAAGHDANIKRESPCRLIYSRYLQMKAEIEELRKKCDSTTDETPIK